MFNEHLYYASLIGHFDMMMKTNTSINLLHRGFFVIMVFIPEARQFACVRFGGDLSFAPS